MNNRKFSYRAARLNDIRKKRKNIKAFIESMRHEIVNRKSF